MTTLDSIVERLPSVETCGRREEAYLTALRALVASGLTKYEARRTLMLAAQDLLGTPDEKQAHDDLLDLYKTHATERDQAEWQWHTKCALGGSR